MQGVHVVRRLTVWIALALSASCSGSATGPDGERGSGVAVITVEPSSATLDVGGETALHAEARDDLGQPVAGVTIVWSVRDSSVARVSSVGVVSARAVGSTQVAASANGRSATASIVVKQAPVGSVSLEPSAASLIVGGTVSLIPAVRDVNGTAVDRPITWESSNSLVATVSTAGLVAGVSAGAATITATSEGRSAAASITVTRAPVGSVEVLPASATVVTGEQAALSVTVKDANGTVVSDRVVTWRSADPGIAIVSTTGVVTGVAPGSARISAASEGTSDTAVVTVVRPAIANVTVQPESASLRAGASSSFTATVRDASGSVVTDAPVVWSSSNSAVATVTQGGSVTGVAVGEATISATSGGKSGSATVHVVAVPVGSVSVAPAALSLVPAQVASLAATVRDANGVVVSDRPVAWSSSDAAVATVSADGAVTGVAPGSATITATSEDKSGSASVTVTRKPVGSVIVTPPSVELTRGESVSLSATVRDTSGVVVTDRDITWRSSDPGVAIVSTSGGVTGIAAGSATITATSEGTSGSAAVTVVNPPVASVTVEPSSASVTVGATTTLTATVRDANGAVVNDRPVAWRSSNDAVATVSPDGVVTGVAPGTTTISATSEGKSGSASVTVTRKPVGSVEVTPPSAEINAGTTLQLSATVRDTSGDVVTDREVTWTSSDESVATVSTSGVVSALDVGTATITAVSEGKSGSAVVTVRPVPVASVSVDPGTATITPNQTVQVTATTRSEDGTVLTGRVITWSSDNESVARVSSDGVVTGIAPGSASITATSEGKSASATVTVQPAVAYVVVSPHLAFIRKNGTIQMSASAFDADGHEIFGRTVTWDTSDEQEATVTSDGLVKGKHPGVVSITATIDGKSDTAIITVTN